MSCWVRSDMRDLRVFFPNLPRQEATTSLSKSLATVIMTDIILACLNAYRIS